ncbi:MAG: recombinase family protein [Oscillospiraceae bacterium]|nr:recombinase family protein [Oscillospiraceae bacterium]MBR6595194.1 recombinase family protein [Oscillospiraceae bacterium]
MAQSKYSPGGILRVALYIRVSTEEQAMHGYSLQAQEDNLIQYAQEHGYKIVGIYRDEGNSARKPITKRKVVLQLLEDVEAGKLDLILFIKLDRWTRNVEAYHTVQKVLDAHNVSWQTTMEDYETLTANGRFKVNIMLSVNESESDRTSERIRFVFEGKRQRREWCFTGGPDQWPYGYMPQVIDGVKRCVKNPETEPILQDFWDYVVKYNSVRKAGMFCCEKYGITRHYRSWMVTARNELYTGTFYGVEEYCPAYISRADWERIILGHKLIKKTQNPERVYLFTGLIRCPCCGNTLKGTFKTYPSDRAKEYNGYRCNNSKLRICDFPHQLSERKIEKQLNEGIREKMKEFILETEIRQAEKKAQPKVHDLVALNEQLRRLNNIYIAGNISDEDYSKETTRIKGAIEKAKQAESENKPIDLTKLRELYNSNFIGTYEQLPKEDQRRFWRSLLEEIYIDGTSITGVKFRL